MNPWKLLVSPLKRRQTMTSDSTTEGLAEALITEFAEACHAAGLASDGTRYSEAEYLSERERRDKAEKSLRIYTEGVVAERDVLLDRCDRLREAYGEAIEDIESWAGYASEYFCEKHDLEGCLKRHRAALQGERT